MAGENAGSEFRPRSLLRALNDHGVTFVIIGGVAVGAHGYPRATQDLDVVPAPDRGNMERLAAALESLDARLVGVDADALGIELDAESLGQRANFPLDTIHGRLDVLQELGDLVLYEEVAQDTLGVEIDGVDVQVCSLGALRRLKHASGRPQDVADLAALDEIDGPEG